jgi:hypothetical protein
MHIIGQVYNPVFTEKTADKSAQFKFTLGHRRAFVEEGESTMLFTRCVAYNGLAPILAKNFGLPEHHGKWIALSGHMDEFEWMPDPANPQHAKYYQKVIVTQELLKQAGFILAEGSPVDVAFEVPNKQITKQIVISGFEFVGSLDGSSTPKPKAPADGGIRIAGQQAASGAIAQPAGVKGADDMPF